MSETSKLKIPNNEFDNFKFILNLDDEIKNKFVSTIKNASLGVSENTIFDLLKKNLKDELSVKTIHQIFSIYINLINTKEQLKVSNNDFLNYLKIALKETEDNDLIKASDHSISFFELLFNTDNNFDISKKIENEYTQNEKNFIGLRVITDVRTVFENNDYLGSTIVNKLKISYQENEFEKEIFISVDEIDLDNLINEIKNAKKNINYIKENFKQLNLINIK